MADDQAHSIHYLSHARLDDALSANHLVGYSRQFGDLCGDRRLWIFQALIAIHNTVERARLPAVLADRNGKVDDSVALIDFKSGRFGVNNRESANRFSGCIFGKNMLVCDGDPAQHPVVHMGGKASRGGFVLHYSNTPTAMPLTGYIIAPTTYPFVFKAASFAAINDRIASDISNSFSHCSL